MSECEDFNKDLEYIHVIYIYMHMQITHIIFACAYCNFKLHKYMYVCIKICEDTSEFDKNGTKSIS